MFQDKFNKIKTLLLTISAIKYLEWYLDQDKKEGGIVNVPCVFINFRPAQIKGLNKYTEEVTLNFDVILITNNLKATSKLGDESNDHFDLEDAIQTKLKHFEKIGFEPINKSKTGMIRSSLSYQLHFTQNTSLGKNFLINKTPASPNVLGEIN